MIHRSQSNAGIATPVDPVAAAGAEIPMLESLRQLHGIVAGPELVVAIPTSTGVVLVAADASVVGSRTLRVRE